MCVVVSSNVDIVVGVSVIDVVIGVYNVVVGVDT